MRKINKLEPPQFFVDFVKKSKPMNWSDCEGKVKLKAKEFMLLEEQRLLCGYTEIFIDNEDCHIDHYVKRSIDNRLCYNWNNLIVAVNDDEFGAKCKDNGVACVKNIRDYESIINPVIDLPESFFKYSLDGQIASANGLSNDEKIKAEKTIEVFALDHPSLKDRRRDIAIIIQTLKEGGVDISEIPLYLEESGFYSFTEYVLKNYF